MTDDLKNLLITISADVNDVYHDAPIMAQLCFAQAVHESNLLNKPSQLATAYMNLFGIKGIGTNGTIKLPTWEHINGEDVKIYAPFAFNASYRDSVEQHRKLMEKDRYKAVWKAKNLEEAANAVYRAGYATDPKYPTKVINNYKKVIEILK